MTSPEIYVLANNIRSLYNVGSLFRLCDGVGVTKLFLCGMTGAPYERLKYERQRNQIAKTALEGLANVPWEYHEDALTVIGQLKVDGVQLVALEQTPTSHLYTSAVYQSPVCLILGHEADGVESRVLDEVDMAVEIPMAGAGKSLNVISAASVMLYHLKISMNPAA
jgi:23S rRNA (guanosine2251-2'-O)-methyltransferase